MKSFWMNGYSGRQDRWAPDGHRWVAGEPRKNGYDRWDYRDDRPELFCVGSGDQLSPEFLMFQSGSRLSPHISPKTEESRSPSGRVRKSTPRPLCEREYRVVALVYRSHIRLQKKLQDWKGQVEPRKRID